jgi:outer membrane protein assembly factor BamB
MINIVLLALVLTAIPVCYAEEWSRFRGPNGTGIATDLGYPVTFSKTEIMRWRTPARKGKSSPVLTETRIFITSFEDEKLYTQGFDRSSGELLWERFEPGPRSELAHQLMSHQPVRPLPTARTCTSSSTTSASSATTRKARFAGGCRSAHFQNSMGHSASLIQLENSVILLTDQDEHTAIASYRMSNGELNWTSDRGDLTSCSTPILYEPSDGEPQIITASRYELNAHSTATGEALWAHAVTSMAVAPSPIVVSNTEYNFGCGYETPLPFSRALIPLDTDKDRQV